ncbi:hypothetical protein Clacol_003125 [Clathrus columnatus]|uniref:Jacalin-type lectin domain-containing protein n=1 Tax=Clathrus columnatus TaxID=1419009 RepID=A0AAV5AAF0_9AGAM|nr:hypothetical protein Clacol_003125 [Clathrus columnatus]
MANWIVSNNQGGAGGNIFDDLVDFPAIANNYRLTTINHWSGNVLNGLQCVWVNPQGNVIVGNIHGEANGAAGTINLAAGERIIFVHGRSGNRIDTLSLIVNDGEQLISREAPLLMYHIGRAITFGGNGGQAFNWPINLVANPNASLHHFRGRSAAQIDAAQAVFRQA